MAVSAEQIKQQYPGYAGWNDPNAIIADYNATGGAGKGGTAYSLGTGVPWQTIQPNKTQTPNTTQQLAQTVSNTPQTNTQTNPAGTPQNVQDLINLGYGGYAGWGDTEAIADFKATGGNNGKWTGLPGGGGLGGAGGFNMPTIDLVGLYNRLIGELGITDIEADLATKAQQLTDAKAQINDNPFLSEATRVGRIAKLDQIYNETVANIQNKLATKKADLEMRLNLEMKQFDINSEAVKTAWSQFNTLLTSGALNNASGIDIANITRATGIPSSMIQSAIDANKDDIETTVMQHTSDDGTVTVSVINSSTGEVINQTNLGQVGNAQNNSTNSAQDKIQNLENAKSDILRGETLQGLIERFQAVLDVKELYALYNANSPYGKAKETLEQVLRGVYATEEGFRQATPDVTQGS